MPSFLCDYINEIVVLADGRVTTCCLDPLGVNVFGNIATDSFYEIEKKYLDIRERITHEISSMPKCQICYRKIKDSGFKQTGTYQVNPSAEDIMDFLNSNQVKIQQMVIELTIKCNLKCNGCMQSRVDFAAHRHSAYLDTKALMSWFNDALEGIKCIRLYNYGETFLHPEAIELIGHIKKKSPATVVSVATNGMLLNTENKQEKLVRSGVDELLFSIHGSSQESIEQYMGSGFDFSQILDVIHNLQKLKKGLRTKVPRIIWKYLLFEWNDSDEEIERAERLARELDLGPVHFDIPGYPAPTKRFRKDTSCPYKIQKIIH